MSERNSKTVEINYKIADGKTVPVEVSPEVARFLKQEEKRERTQRRDDRRFLDKAGYVEGETELLIYDLGQDVLDKVAVRERNTIVNNAINHLLPRQKNYIHAYYFKGYTVQEIADMEEIDKAAVSRILSKARKELRFYLEHYQQFWGYQQKG